MLKLIQEIIYNVTGKSNITDDTDFVKDLELNSFDVMNIVCAFDAVKGKGGKVRTVPIEDERILMMLKRVLAQTERGHKLLVPDGMPTDRAINALELFIYRYRNGISDEGSDRRLTFHGLRHTYAAEKYTRLTEDGMSAIDAHYAVSRLLGHERADVTNIYLASVRKRGRDGE